MHTSSSTSPSFSIKIRLPSEIGGFWEVATTPAPSEYVQFVRFLLHKLILSHSESTSIPKNPRTERPVGYAFVDLSTPTEAERAISELSGKEILDRKVSVQLARKPETNDKTETAASGGEGQSGGEGGRRRQSGRGRGRARGRGGRRNNAVSFFLRDEFPRTTVY